MLPYQPVYSREMSDKIELAKAEQQQAKRSPRNSLPRLYSYSCSGECDNMVFKTFKNKNIKSHYIRMMFLLFNISSVFVDSYDYKITSLIETFLGLLTINIKIDKNKIFYSL